MSKNFRTYIGSVALPGRVHRTSTILVREQVVLCTVSPTVQKHPRLLVQIRKRKRNRFITNKRISRGYNKGITS